MATRFYWGQIITAPAPAFSAAWSAPGSTPTRLMMRTVKRKAATTAVVASATETTAAILNKQHVQLVSMPLAAQTITGTVKGYALFSESDTAQDCRVQCEIRIISPTGTVRGTLLAANTDALSSEFDTTPTNRRIPLLAATNTLTSVSAQDGDYLVVEIGHRTHVASGTSYTATVRWNDDVSSTDLPEDETDTDATKAPWIEFSQTLILSDIFDGFPPVIPDSNTGAELIEVPLDNQVNSDKSKNDADELSAASMQLELVNRVLNQSTDTIDPTFFEPYTIGSILATAFDPLISHNINTIDGAVLSQVPMSDFGPVSTRVGDTFVASSSFLNLNLVEPTSHTTGGLLQVAFTRYVNRVYDSIASKFVRWTTNNPDTIGAAYPGPGVFGITTSDYVVESSLVT